MQSNILFCSEYFSHILYILLIICLSHKISHFVYLSNQIETLTLLIYTCYIRMCQIWRLHSPGSVWIYFFGIFYPCSTPYHMVISVRSNWNLTLHINICYTLSEWNMQALHWFLHIEVPFTRSTKCAHFYPFSTPSF